MNIILSDSLIENFFVISFLAVLLIAWGYFLKRMYFKIGDVSNNFFDWLDSFLENFKKEESEYI